MKPYFLMFFVVFIIGCTTNTTNDFNSENDEIIDSEKEIKITDDGIKYLIHPDDIVSGGPPKGGIGKGPGIAALALENLNFVSVEEANEFIDDEQLVLALIHDGEKRVYPMQILVFHEIVNDEINNDPVLITFCPLCGSGIAYERTIEFNNERIETRFGTSGKLYNSNLVMYDEETNTYWQQIDGNAIVGELTGQELIEIDLDTIKWGEWKKEHPDSKVLSKETGFLRPYGDDDGPYDGYYESDYLIFNPNEQDSRLHAKDVVFSLVFEDIPVAFREKDLEEGNLELEVNGVILKAEKLSDGRVEIIRQDTGEKLPKERDFWFAWYAFHPDTLIYGF